MRTEIRAQEMSQMHPLVRTERLYVPSRLTAEQMTVEQLKRGLCPKSRGDWHVCEQCQGGCSYGKRLADVMLGRAVAPEKTPEHVPARESKPPRETSNRGYMSSDKRIAFAVEACKRILAGESYSAIAQEHGYTPSGLREMIKRVGMELPESRMSNVAKQRERIRKHVAMMEAIEGGMDCRVAAVAIGGYASWSRAKEYGKNHKEAIDAAIKAKKQAVAQ